jgi:hypothetical protein
LLQLLANTHFFIVKPLSVLAQGLQLLLQLGHPLIAAQHRLERCIACTVQLCCQVAGGSSAISDGAILSCCTQAVTRHAEAGLEAGLAVELGASDGGGTLERYRLTLAACGMR